MLPLDFGDEIVCQRQSTGLTLECDHPALPTDARNLALRAAQKLADRFSVKQGAKIILRKRTPLAAGLGGGSSNAAIVLTTLNQLWELNAPRATLDELAAGMGSDINFFLTGTTALCRGRGEQTEAIDCRLSAAVLLINPGFGISTKWAYENWAKLTETPPAVTVLTRALVQDNLAEVSGALFNSLEAPSVGKFPVLQLLKDAMREHGAAGALMSGSGATVFGLFSDAGKAETCSTAIRREFGPSMWTKVTRFARNLQS